MHSLKPEDRIQTMRVRLPDSGIDIPLYQRYIGDETELWLFGSGLGEHTMFLQMGDCFLQLMEEHDPAMGRIMMGLGMGESAFMTYKGDYNVAWVWGIPPDELAGYFAKLNIKPDLMLCSWDLTRKRAEEHDINTMHMFSGVNPRIFKPLGLERKGLGYAGIDNKGTEQKRIVLDPAIAHGGFEWISQEHSPMLGIDDYNTWLNTKQIVFGMIHESRHQTAYMPTRVTEALASGTPLITYKIRDMNKLLGFKYPYQTSSAEETNSLIDSILTDYETVTKKFEMFSVEVRKKHSYKVKLKQMFDKLETLK